MSQLVLNDHAILEEEACPSKYLDAMGTTWHRLCGPRGKYNLSLSSGVLQTISWIISGLCRLVSDELPVQEVPEAGIISENQDMPHKWIDRTWIHGAKGWAAELASPAR